MMRRAMLRTGPRATAGRGLPVLDRRKRRAIEDRQLKEERKAEKTKCAFCKRYACIC